MPPSERVLVLNWTSYLVDVGIRMLCRYPTHQRHANVGNLVGGASSDPSLLTDVGTISSVVFHPEDAAETRVKPPNSLGGRAFRRGL